MSFQNKYLKYKTKYLNIKKSIGGGFNRFGPPLPPLPEPPVIRRRYNTRIEPIYEVNSQGIIVETNENTDYVEVPYGWRLIRINNTINWYRRESNGIADLLGNVNENIFSSWTLVPPGFWE